MSSLASNLLLASCILAAVDIAIWGSAHLTDRFEGLLTNVAIMILGFAGVGFISAAAIDLNQEGDARVALIKRIETKYDIEVDEYDVRSTVSDPQYWVIDGVPRVCFIEDLRERSTKIYNALADPVLRCEPGKETLPEVG